MAMVRPEAISDAQHHLIRPVPWIDALEGDIVSGELWMRAAGAHAII